MRAFTFCRRFGEFLSGNQARLVGDFEVATSGGVWVAVRILGYTENTSPIHAVIAPDEVVQMLWVITVYEAEP